MVDKLIKMTFCIPTIRTMITFGVANLFLKQVLKHQGLPFMIISNRNAKFVNEFWTTLFKLNGTKIMLSTAYHPKTNGQTKRTNRMLENMLIMYIGKKQHSWNKWLYLIEFAYNENIHSSIGVSSFYVLYGQNCRTPIFLSTSNTKFESINDIIKK